MPGVTCTEERGTIRCAACSEPTGRSCTGRWRSTRPSVPPRGHRPL